MGFEWSIVLIFAIAIVIVIIKEVIQSKKGKTKKQEQQATKQETQKQIKQKDTVQIIHIPVEILPNQYSLELHDVMIKHHQSYTSSMHFDYVTLHCQIRYQLNGKKPGKRRLAFTSYDTQNNIIDTCGDHIDYHFTDAGCDMVKVCFDNCDKLMPRRISVLVKETK